MNLDALKKKKTPTAEEVGQVIIGLLLQNYRRKVSSPKKEECRITCKDIKDLSARLDPLDRSNVRKYGDLCQWLSDALVYTDALSQTIRFALAMIDCVAESQMLMRQQLTVGFRTPMMISDFNKADVGRRAKNAFLTDKKVYTITWMINRWLNFYLERQYEGLTRNNPLVEIERLTVNRPVPDSADETVWNVISDESTRSAFFPTMTETVGVGKTADIKEDFDRLSLYCPELVDAFLSELKDCGLEMHIRSKLMGMERLPKFSSKQLYSADFCGFWSEARQYFEPETAFFGQKPKKTSDFDYCGFNPVLNQKTRKKTVDFYRTVSKDTADAMKQLAAFKCLLNLIGEETGVNVDELFSCYVDLEQQAKEKVARLNFELDLFANGQLGSKKDCDCLSEAFRDFLPSDAMKSPCPTSIKIARNQIKDLKIFSEEPNKPFRGLIE